MEFGAKYWSTAFGDLLAVARKDDSCVTLIEILLFLLK